jgi:mRNA turnover protein 4
MEPQLRACGLSSIKLVRGVPSLEEEVVVCKQGEKLSAEKARLLSLLGIMMAVSASSLSAITYSLC